MSGIVSGTLPVSLVLAAHGADDSPASNRPFFELANRIASSDRFASVTPAFLRGTPRIENVLELLPAGRVVVIPMMTSEGYYSRTVFPALIDRNRRRDRFRVEVRPVMGLHPRWGELVSDRIAAVMERYSLDKRATTIVIVGHGTTRHPTSGEATRTVADGVRRRHRKSGCRVAFLDQAPRLDSVVSDIRTPHLLVVPFMMGRGPHVMGDIPKIVGLTGGKVDRFPCVLDRDVPGRSGTKEGGWLVYDRPVGLYPELSALCLEVAIGSSPVSISDVSRQPSVAGGQSRLAPLPCCNFFSRNG